MSFKDTSQFSMEVQTAVGGLAGRQFFNSVFRLHGIGLLIFRSHGMHRMSAFSHATLADMQPGSSLTFGSDVCRITVTRIKGEKK